MGVSEKLAGNRAWMDDEVIKTVSDSSNSPKKNLKHDLGDYLQVIAHSPGATVIMSSGAADTEKTLPGLCLRALQHIGSNCGLAFDRLNQ